MFVCILISESYLIAAYQLVTITIEWGIVQNAHIVWLKSG